MKHKVGITKPQSQDAAPCCDWIHIHDLALRCIVGIHDFEKQTPREIVVQLSVNTPLAAAGLSDNLANTVDYASLCAAVEAFVTPSRFELIESLAEGIASICLQNARVLRAKVRVEKPAAVPGSRSVSVEIVRSRS